MPKPTLKTLVNKNSPRWAGLNALHFAASFQSLPALKLLLTAGINRHNETCSGKTALDLLNQGVIDTLIMVDLLEDKSLMQRNFSNFQIACMKESKTVVQKFLNHGAVNVNFNISNELSIVCGSTPLHFAVTSKCKQKVKFLLQSGAKVESTDNQNMTSLHLATYNLQSSCLHQCTVNRCWSKA